MPSPRLRRLALIPALLVLAPVSYAAPSPPDAAAIMQRASSVMKGARTYESTWLVTTSMGQMGSMTMRMDLKTIPAQGKVAVTLVPSGQGSGMMAMGAAMASTTVVDDGKNVYMYMKALNGYYKNPHAAGQQLPGATMLNLAHQKGVTFKVVGSQNVGGRPCYVVQANVPLPGNLAQRGIKSRTLMYVDKGTNHLKQVKTVATMPAGMMGGARPGGANSGAPASPPMEFTTLTVLQSEKLNAPIPATAFRFTPPPGAKELKGSPMGMGGLGGMGGAGGPAGH